MFQAAIAIQAKLPQVHFWIPLSKSTDSQLNRQFRIYGLRATVVSGQTQEAIAAADPQSPNLAPST